jgi:hypothetical protein
MTEVLITPPPRKRRRWLGMFLLLAFAVALSGLWMAYREYPAIFSELSLPDFVHPTPPTPPLAPLIAPAPPPPPPEAPPEALQQLQSEIHTLQEKLSKQRSFPLLTALWPLQRAAERGGEFRNELIYFKKQIITYRADAVLWEEAEALEADARAGVATAAALREELAALSGLLASHAPESASRKHSTSWLDQWVRLRATDPHQAHTPLEILLLQCDSALASHDLAQAQTHAEAIAALWQSDETTPILLRYQQWQSRLQQAAIVRQRLEHLFTLIAGEPKE